MNAPRRRKTPAINLGSAWTAMSTAFDEATVDNVLVSVEVRLLAAARAHLESGGHSHWRRGELRGRLKILNKRTGELRLIDRSTLNAAIGRLVESGIFLPDSDSTCLVYQPFAVQTGLKSAPSMRCPRV